MTGSINLLGATGSIGKQTMDVCRKYPQIRINTLAAKSDYIGLASAAKEFSAKKVSIYDKDRYIALKEALSGTDIKVLCGEEGLCECAADEDAECTVNAVVGASGLTPTIAAIRAHRRIALANKETLVAGGSLVMTLARDNGVDIIPIDSEHSAVFQCLQGISGDVRSQVKSLILTASGGPFFGKTLAELKDVTPADALRHPNWTMGSKITIDSATMMNKGFELIEACHLFDMTPDKVDITVHRQSIIHSAIVTADNAVIAQMGVPDMTVPIQYALTFPERYPSSAAPLSLRQIGSLTFEQADESTFSCLKAARRAADIPQTTAGAVINGANEVLVHLFLEGKIGFTDIQDGVNEALNNISLMHSFSLENILKADKAAREFAYERSGVR
ncbi:MAG: 1-deoxy-D-xylulose-5-phosphate reductoisomerase [Oscillospiraceae bacterium]|nr:1-deoxy-D-xylulose-5-phosphate reductoisomerase [Oscillospiraceae bacterium]